MNSIVLEKEATKFRTVNGIGSDDPIKFKSLLKKLNVITVYRPLGEKFSGMAIKLEEDSITNRLILVNNTHSLGKQHFTIAHELYHLYVQAGFDFMTCHTGTFDKKGGEEFNADVFASILLLPENGVKALIPDEETVKDKISLQTILKIEQYFSCSRLALLYRLKELKLITSTLYEKYRINVKKGAILNGYSLDLYESGNKNLVLGNYGELANELYSKGKISESHFYSLLIDLGMNEKELENLSYGEEDC
ncbi:ImmA/IrrE family metallo-endopeptidase [Chryseobacterium koreense]